MSRVTDNCYVCLFLFFDLSCWRCCNRMNKNARERQLINDLQKRTLCSIELRKRWQPRVKLGYKSHHKSSLRGSLSLNETLCPLCLVFYAMSPQPGWVIFNEMLHTNKILIKDLTEIDPVWLEVLAPHYYEKVSLRSWLWFFFVSNKMLFELLLLLFLEPSAKDLGII